MRGDRLSNAARPRQVFFRSGERRSKFVAILDTTRDAQTEQLLLLIAIIIIIIIIINSYY